MGKVIEKTNFRVEVEIAHNPWHEPEDEEIIRDLKEIVEGIKRHVDNVGSVVLAYDTEQTCEFCCNPWTEGDSPHNEGCCDKDIELMEAT